ncbi:MAG: hypothetical protein WAO00_14000 [Chthoniobacterales bacterium]
MKKQQKEESDWADKVAARIMKKSSTTGRRYCKDLREELELKIWSPKATVPVWCGTKPIAAALRRAYKRGFADAKRDHKA